MLANKPNIDSVLKSDPKLYDSDERLNVLYGSILLSVDKNEQATLRTEQRDWIKERNQEFAKNKDQNALNEMYQARVDALKDQLREINNISIDTLLKYPALWDEIGKGRFTPDIDAKISVSGLPSFKV